MQTAIQSTQRTLAVVCLLLPALALAGYRAEVGYDRLQQEFGSKLPDGGNLVLMQVEAPDASGCWATSTGGELAGKRISFPFSTTTPTKFSGHADVVGTTLLGASSSLLPGAPALFSASSGAYRNTSLRLGQFSSPGTATWDLENHSYAGNVGTYNANALQLLDHRANRDGTTVVAALENGTGPLPALFANCYNIIAVGVSSGNHSQGGSNLEIAGRQKPDLVAPSSFTSYATPMVSSAAGLLIAEAKRTPRLAAARNPRVIKALLLAGATKDEFPTWSGTPTRPLDPIYGAGELNIANAYHTLLAGPHAPGKALRPTAGWDTRPTASAANVYHFEVPTGRTLDLSVALTWHREQTTANFFTFTGDLPNLSLRLRRSDTSFASGHVLAESNSPIDNVEHVFRRALPAGIYALEIGGPAATTYGLAWFGTLSTPTAPLAPTLAPLPEIVTATSIQSDTLAPVPPGPKQPALLARTTSPIRHGGDGLGITFTITGYGRRMLLLRGLGPALGTNGIARPVLALSRSSRLIASNAGWKAANANRIRLATAAVGATPLGESGRDATLLVALPAGTYSLKLGSRQRTGGQARIEIFDLAPNSRTTVRLTGLAGAAPLEATLGPKALPSIGYLVGAEGDTLAAPALGASAAGVALGENTGWSTDADAAEIAEIWPLADTDTLPPETLSALLLPAQADFLDLTIGTAEEIPTRLRCSIRDAEL